MKIEDLTKSSYGNIITTKIPGDPVLFYSYAFYEQSPVGIGVWDCRIDICLAAIIINKKGEKIYLNKIDSNDVLMSEAYHELENSLEEFVKKSR